MNDNKMDDIRKYALGIHMEGHSGGILRLVFDDLVADGHEEGLSWRRRSFYTHLDLPEGRARSHQLDEEQYTAIGEAVLARLIAFLEVAKSRSVDE